MYSRSKLNGEMRCFRCLQNVDGQWSNWVSTATELVTSFDRVEGICTYTSGDFTRTCDNPVPQWGGTACEGTLSLNVSFMRFYIISLF